MSDKELLYKLYWDEGKSLEQIGREVGITPSGVMKRMNKYGIDRRPNVKHLYDDLRKIPLTSYQKNVVIGGVLGDSYLECSYKVGVRLRIKHCVKQKPYLLYKKDKLSNIFMSDVASIQQCRFGKNLFSEEIVSIVHPDLLYIYNIFYPDGKKVTPLDFYKYLNPVVLSIWFMDDGCFCTGKNVVTLRFSTESFSLEENKILQKSMYDVFGIEMHISKHKHQYVLQTGKKSSIKTILKMVYSEVGDLFLTCKGGSSTTKRQALLFIKDDDIV